MQNTSAKKFRTPIPYAVLGYTPSVVSDLIAKAKPRIVLTLNGNQRRVWRLPTLKVVPQVRRDETASALHRLQRRQALLSGLVVCGICGGSYTTVDKDRYGCATHRSKGSCTNALSITRNELETRVLTVLKDKLRELEAKVHPQPRASRSRPSRAGCLESDLKMVESKIAHMLKAIEDGMYNPAMKERMVSLEAHKAEIQSRLPSTPSSIPPNVAKDCREKIARLEAALAAPNTNREAAEMIRSQIASIALKPEGYGLTVELRGNLPKTLGLSKETEPQRKLLGNGGCGESTGAATPGTESTGAATPGTDAAG